jgi:hypothetical protein
VAVSPRALLVAFTRTQGHRCLSVLTRLRIATDPGDSLLFLGIIDKGEAAQVHP